MLSIGRFLVYPSIAIAWYVGFKELIEHYMKTLGETGGQEMMQIARGKPAVHALEKALVGALLGSFNC